MSFLDEINSLIVLDNAKTRPEIVNELKRHLAGRTDVREKNKTENFVNSSIFHTQFQNFYKGMFFLM
ncbi:hypothetical protein ACQ9BO_19200 [Flavobacterium sp. P21]|uniref:hypothetical protein n=1 Tax=Flavobacterium sp. P21 TaxID=3423948 RepID=UPI003D6744C1